MKGRNRLLEYTFQTSLQEADDDLELDSPIEGEEAQTPPQNQAPMSELPQGNGDMGNEEMPPMEDGEMGDEDIPSIDGEEIEDGDMLDMDIEDIDMEEDGDEVIDVTELTDSQEDISSKINSMMSKFKLVVNKINTVGDRIENLYSQSDKKIDSIKTELTKEIEKRLPTDSEKMNLRTLDSGPFNVSPKDYWDEKSKDSRYDIYANNQVSPQDEQEYVLTMDDVKNGSFNSRDVSKSMEGDYADSLSKIFKY